MNRETTIRDAVRLIEDMIYTGTIEMLEIEYKDDEQAWLDHLQDELTEENNRVMRDYFEVSFENVENKILWYIADKFKDDKLVNDLIEEDIERKEEEYDDLLKSME